MRLVLIAGTRWTVYEGRKVVAEYEAGPTAGPEDVEWVRTAQVAPAA